MRITTMLNGFIVLAALTARLILNAQAKENKQQTKLESKARITKDTVQETALAKARGILKLIWSFDVERPDSKEITEVAEDVVTSRILPVAKQTPEEQTKEKAQR